jgi:hypothetical protein
VTSCQACRTASVQAYIDAGPQPILNRFLDAPNAPQYVHRMVVGQCSGCGLVQIPDPVPAEEIRPRVSWITYSEPEAHLDAMVRRIVALPGVTAASRIAGLSFKDDSTLSRLAAHGFTSQRSLDQRSDLGIEESGAGVETIQRQLTAGAGRRIRDAHGAYEMVIARHILEHAHDLRGFLGQLTGLVSPGGYVVLEVPDCEPSFTYQEFTTLWEEHIVYFTPATFRHALEAAELSLVDFYVHPYPFENSLIAICRREGLSQPGMPEETLAEEADRFRRFAAGVPDYGRRVRNHLRAHRTGNGGVAMFGAGHLGAMYINLFELGSLIDFVVDDHPSKRGLFMPGSGLSVRGSSALFENDISLCLLAVNPQSEEKVMAQNAAFVERGGTFASIFATSRVGLPLARSQAAEAPQTQ